MKNEYFCFIPKIKNRERKQLDGETYILFNRPRIFPVMKDIEEIKENQNNIYPLQLDITSDADVKQAIDAIVKKVGRIDVVVNNAGIIDDGLLLRMKDTSWERVINTNLNGTFYCSRSVIRSMVKTRWGRIINIGSVVGLRGNIGQTNYTASKAAINGFTFALAKEVATRNITVNTITPGYINTDTVEDLSEK